MKVLSFINISNPISLETDSSVIIHRILQEQYHALGHEFVIASPVPLPYGINTSIFSIGGEIQKYTVRFAFPWQQVVDCLQKNRPDIILVHQVEWAQKIRAVMTSLGLTIPLVSYAHYIPAFLLADGTISIDSSLNNNKLGNSVLYEFLSGVEASDKIFVQSEYAKEVLKRILQNDIIHLNDPQIYILPPPADPLMTKNIDNTAMDLSARKKTIVYNHRLYEHYGNTMLRECIENIREYVWVICDVMPQRSATRTALDSSVSKMKEWLMQQPNVQMINASSNRAEYIKAIATARVVMAAYRENAVWSMSCVDAMSLGTPVVAASIGAYPEFIPHAQLYTNRNECFEKIEQLMRDDELWQSASSNAYRAVQNLHAQDFARGLIGEN